MAASGSPSSRPASVSSAILVANDLPELHTYTVPVSIGGRSKSRSRSRSITLSADGEDASEVGRELSGLVQLLAVSVYPALAVDPVVEVDGPTRRSCSVHRGARCEEKGEASESPVDGVSEGIHRGSRA